jgi:hypothetical protein
LLRANIVQESLDQKTNATPHNDLQKRSKKLYSDKKGSSVINATFTTSKGKKSPRSGGHHPQESITKFKRASCGVLKVSEKDANHPVLSS